MFKTNLFCLRHTMTKFVVPTQMYKIQYAIQYDELSLSNPGVREEFANVNCAVPYITYKKTFSGKAISGNDSQGNITFMSFISVIM